MKAWRVHDFGEPRDVFALDEIDPPTAFNRTLVGATLGSYPHDFMRRTQEETHAALLELLAAGAFRPQVTQAIDFDDVPAALTALAERRTMGRVVVRVRERR